MMTPITVTLLSRLEHVFNLLQTPTSPGLIVYYQGVYYFISEAFYHDAIATLQNRYAGNKLLQFADFAFRLENNLVVLIKNRRTFEDVAVLLDDRGWTVTQDVAGCRVVTDV